MVLLGVGVRNGATPVDAWMQQARGRPLGGSLSELLFLTDYRTTQVMMLAAVAVALYRRVWALIPLIIAVPLVAVLMARGLKPLFGRFKGDALAYPSGHTTLMVAALGMLILAIGVRRWLIWAAVAFATLAVIGQSVTYHYVTDAVGALLLGTSLVCLAVVLLRRLRRLL